MPKATQLERQAQALPDTASSYESPSARPFFSLLQLAGHTGGATRGGQERPPALCPQASFDGWGRKKADLPHQPPSCCCRGRTGPELSWALQVIRRLCSTSQPISYKSLPLLLYHLHPREGDCSLEEDGLLAPLTRAAGTHNGKEEGLGGKGHRHRTWGRRTAQQLQEGTHCVHPSRQQAGGGQA